MHPTLSNGRYRIERLLGKGGMGAVFLAYDTNLCVYRAVKLLHPDYIVHPSIRQRFINEARAMAQLNHAHIVNVFDQGMEGATLFLVMDSRQVQLLQSPPQIHMD